MARRPDPADFLLGELDEADREAAERLIADDPAYRDEVERLRPLVAQLDVLPIEAWEAARPAPAPRGRTGLVLRPAIAALASAALVAAGLGAGLLLGGGEGDGEGVPVSGSQTPAASFVLEPVEGSAAGSGAGAEMVQRDGEAVLTVSGLEPSAGDERYELWLLDAPDRLLSLGAFRVPESGEATVTVPLPIDPSRYGFIDISVERDDGDPGHSGDSVLRGAT